MEVNIYHATVLYKVYTMMLTRTCISAARPTYVDVRRSLLACQIYMHAYMIDSAGCISDPPVDRYQD